MRKRQPYSIEQAAYLMRKNPSALERKLRDWLELRARRDGWPSPEYSQVIGGFVFPIVFREAKLAVDIDKNRYLACQEAPPPKEAQREEAAQEAGLTRFKILDASVWSYGPGRALEAVRVYLEENGFMEKDNPMTAIKEALYHKRVAQADRRSRRTAQTLREAVLRTAKTHPRRMRARAAQLPD